jgi:gluconolactonase
MTAEHASRRDAALTRRTLVTAMAVGAGAVAAGSGRALAQAQAEKPAAPPTTVTSPPRDFSPNGAPTTYFWDPDIVFVDPSFGQYAQPNAAITRLWTGALWAEGPAWSAQGRYLLWSDIPNNRQMRWLEDNGEVSI